MNCAHFEQQTLDNIAGYNSPVQPDTGFVRRVLAQGMEIERVLGVNPYGFGVVASTDTHLGTPGATQEDRFLGHGDAGVPAKDSVPPGLPDKLEYNPGGLAVIWAEENSRDALFGAMRRKEVYGTSGPRIVRRFFGAWNYPDNLCASPGRIAEAYAGGVPMGGTPLRGTFGCEQTHISRCRESGCGYARQSGYASTENPDYQGVDRCQGGAP